MAKPEAAEFEGVAKPVTRWRIPILGQPGVWWCPWCGHSNQDDLTVCGNVRCKARLCSPLQPAESVAQQPAREIQPPSEAVTPPTEPNAAQPPVQAAGDKPKKAKGKKGKWSKGKKGTQS